MSITKERATILQPDASWRAFLESGQFLYIFGEAFEEGDPRYYSFLHDYSEPLKIGITRKPEQRIKALRETIKHGIWYDIQWIASGAELIEKCLHELLNPWRCGFEREYFCLPMDVRNWLHKGMRDRWERIQTHHDRCPHSGIREIAKEIIPFNYPAPWLSERLNQFNDLS